MHDDVIKWKHFPRNWPFVREIHRSPVNFPHKGQWRGALMFSLNYAWINDWVNNREAGDLRRQHGHYDVIVMVYLNGGGCPAAWWLGEKTMHESAGWISTSRISLSVHNVLIKVWNIRVYVDTKALLKAAIQHLLKSAILLKSKLKRLADKFILLIFCRRHYRMGFIQAEFHVLNHISLNFLA